LKWLALAEALAVVGLWSLSPILVKSALADVLPQQIAGVRYTLGFVSLLPWILLRPGGPAWPTRSDVWLRLCLMGILAFPIGNTLLFWALETIPSTTSAFLLNAIPVATLALGAWWLRELPGRTQWVGIGLAFLGAAVFFGEGIRLGDGRAIGASLLGCLALAVFGVLGRQLLRRNAIDVFQLSALPMGIGGGLLLALFPPRLTDATPIGILVFLGVVNSALAYILWNHALRVLAAFEISIVGNLLPMGTALWAPFTLGEVVPVRSWAGILISFLGVGLVALSRRPGERGNDLNGARSSGTPSA
jgi:drug/metabolite transporter (DMT)-like permease